MGSTPRGFGPCCGAHLTSEDWLVHKPPSLKLLTCFSEETKSSTPLLSALGVRGPAFGIIARNSSDLVLAELSLGDFLSLTLLDPRVLLKHASHLSLALRSRGRGLSYLASLAQRQGGLLYLASASLYQVEVRTLNFAGCLRSPKGDGDFSLLASASLLAVRRRGEDFYHLDASDRRRVMRTLKSPYLGL
ncbi:hypothetical protein VNO80_15960 [Phaseolus coccineus]|uniref:Uncharacterized protein n=1 Tax=Phaseolus coccineus TaxID=3886 RepID=A0AAN9MKU2_PHACN